MKELNFVLPFFFQLQMLSKGMPNLQSVSPGINLISILILKAFFFFFVILVRLSYLKMMAIMAYTYLHRIVDLLFRVESWWTSSCSFSLRINASVGDLAGILIRWYLSVYKRSLKLQELLKVKVNMCIFSSFFCNSVL